MLVLSRAIDQQLRIGDDIVITVVAIRGRSARIGVTAPRKIVVHRQEVADAIRREKEGRDRQ